MDRKTLFRHITLAQLKVQVLITLMGIASRKNQANNHHLTVDAHISILLSLKNYIVAPNKLARITKDAETTFI